MGSNPCIFAVPVCLEHFYFMIVISEDNPEHKKIEVKINTLSEVKGFDAAKYKGKLKWGQDPVAFQKDLRKRK